MLGISRPRTRPRERGPIYVTSFDRLTSKNYRPAAVTIPIGRLKTDILLHIRAKGSRTRKDDEYENEAPRGLDKQPKSLVEIGG